MYATSMTGWIRECVAQKNHCLLKLVASRVGGSPEAL